MIEGPYQLPTTLQPGFPERLSDSPGPSAQAATGGGANELLAQGPWSGKQARELPVDSAQLPLIPEGAPLETVVDLGVDFVLAALQAE